MEATHRSSNIVADVTYREHRYATIALGQASTFANGQRFHLVVPVNQHATPTRIADGHGPVDRLCGEHQVAQVVLVDGCSHHHARDTAQVGQVEQTVMRHSILADQTTAVDAERNRQMRDGHIVDNVIVGSLQE